MVAIVILNWNGAEYLQKFLPKLIEHTQMSDVEIVVADNASSDNSLQMLATEFPTVKVIILEKNFGFAEGYNKALLQLKSEYFLLLNSDVEVSENWLFPLLDFMRENPKVAVCQPKIRSFHARDYFEYAGASGGFIDKFGYPFCRGRVLGNLEKDDGQYDDVARIFWATGACFLVRAEVRVSSAVPCAYSLPDATHFPIHSHRAQLSLDGVHPCGVVTRPSWTQ